MKYSDNWLQLYGRKGNGMGSLLNIELGRENAEVIRDVYAANPHITGVTMPKKISDESYVIMTNEPVPGSAGLRRIYHVNGKVRELHNSFDIIGNPRCEGTKLEFRVMDGKEERTETKRIWAMPLWEHA